MKTEEVIEMANDAEICQCIWIDDKNDETVASVIRFAKLVAVKERERMIYSSPQVWIEEALKAEREACAKLCDALAEDYGKAGLPMTYNALTATAKEIRARSEA
jgi:transglutaminase/protease-like cytokinesis protein 3